MGERGPGDCVDGRYLLRREIGRGGMATVFEARHVHTGRTVALKVLLARHLRALGLRERLLREASVLGGVDHPAIVEVYDAGLDRDGCPYVAMEMLTGRTLDGILASRTTLTPEDTVNVGRQLCDALSALHAHGVVHRDVKPGNVFLVRDSLGNEVAKLVDFGVALLPASPDGPERPARNEKLTPSDEVLGTPEYMSPEQLFAQPVDARSDVYAAGITLYECLAGRVPFPGGLMDVVRSFAVNTPLPALRAAREDVDPRLAAAIERAIAREPARRYPDARAFRDALEGASGLARANTGLLGLQQAFGDAPAPLAPPPSIFDLSSDSPMPLVRTRPVAIALHRRRYPRVPYVTPVQISRADGSELDARSEEISETGMLLLTEDSFQNGEVVRARFALPTTGEVVTVDATTPWVRTARGRFALGMEFKGAPAAVRHAIAQYATSIAPPK